MYTEDARKVVHNYLWKDSSPQCHIDIKTAEDYFQKLFSDDREEFIDTDDDGIFNVSGTINEGEEDWTSVLSSKNIREVVKSRNINSAAGPDGIPYSIFMKGGESAICFLKSMSLGQFGDGKEYQHVGKNRRRFC